MKIWYAVQTHSRKEHVALANLRRQGFEVYYPQYLKRRRHARRTDWVKSPLFPNYLFVALDPVNTAWRCINSTIGAKTIISFGGAPAPMPEGVVEKIMAGEDEAGMARIGRQTPYDRGQPVKILGGAFSGHTGLFDCAVDDERVTILLNLLGRQLKIGVPYDIIVSAA